MNIGKLSAKSPPLLAAVSIMSVSFLNIRSISFINLAFWLKTCFIISLLLTYLSHVGSF